MSRTRRPRTVRQVAAPAASSTWLADWFWAPINLNAFVDEEHMLTREAPDLWQGLAMLSSRIADLGRDGWRVDAAVETGYVNSVFLSRENSWYEGPGPTSSDRRARCRPSQCCCTYCR